VRKLSSLTVSPEELLAVEGDCAEEAGATVGARCQYYGLASALGPYVAGDGVVEEDGFVLA